MQDKSWKLCTSRTIPMFIIKLLIFEPITISFGNDLYFYRSHNNCLWFFAIRPLVEKRFVSSVNVKFVLQYVSDSLSGTPVCHINIYLYKYNYFIIYLSMSRHVLGNFITYHLTPVDCGKVENTTYLPQNITKIEVLI